MMTYETRLMAIPKHPELYARLVLADGMPKGTAYYQMRLGSWIALTMDERLVYPDEPHVGYYHRTLDDAARAIVGTWTPPR